MPNNFTNFSKLSDFYKNKRIFITGDTGFKGAWLCKILLKMGAKVFGFALPPNTTPSLFELLALDKSITHTNGDIRELHALSAAFNGANPEIVFHLAAQPLVLDGYDRPAYTFDVNVMGTVNILECVRSAKSVVSFLNITTDKVYKNNEWLYGYRETDVLAGVDPYSCSKSCSELVTASYAKSFAAELPAVSTARAGNVIGGGDFAPDRIIPDCVKACQNAQPITIRNPNSVRPFQHVLEPLFCYLQIAAAQSVNGLLADCYNIGPDYSDCITALCLANIFCAAWGDGAACKVVQNKNAPKEAELLMLDCSKMKKVFGFKPTLSVAQAVEWCVDFAKAHAEGKNLNHFVDTQIDTFVNMAAAR
jgi:CDP-glucose 4,6-dehydratase